MAGQLHEREAGEGVQEVGGRDTECNAVEKNTLKFGKNRQAKNLGANTTTEQRQVF